MLAAVARQQKRMRWRHTRWITTPRMAETGAAHIIRRELAPESPAHGQPSVLREGAHTRLLGSCATVLRTHRCGRHCSW